MPFVMVPVGGTASPAGRMVMADSRTGALVNDAFGCDCVVCRVDRLDYIRGMNEAPPPSFSPPTNESPRRQEQETMPPPAFSPPTVVPMSARAHRRLRRKVAAMQAASQAATEVASNLKNWCRLDYSYCTGLSEWRFGSADLSYPAQPIVRVKRTSLNAVESMTPSQLESFIRECWKDGCSFVQDACNCSECRYNRRSWFAMPLDVEKRQAELFKELMGEPEEIRNARQWRKDMAASFARSEENDSEESDFRVPDARTESWNDTKAKGGAKRFVGVEVEFNNRDNDAGNEWVGLWSGGTIHSDGSCGWEAVTPPMNGRYVAECLSDLMADLNVNDAGCDNSCGLHVHVDARDMKWHDIRRFCKLWGRIESLMFVLGGQSRISNRGSYCRPCGKAFSTAAKAEDWKNAILDVAINNNVAGGPEKRGRQSVLRGVDKKGGGRYKSVNIMPWIAGRAFNRPDITVEFRLHMGSHDAKQVTAWCHLLQDIVEWCVAKSDTDLAALPKSAARILAVISPRSKTWLVKRIGAWRRDTNPTRAKRYTGAGTEKPARMVNALSWAIKPQYERAS